MNRYWKQLLVRLALGVGPLVLTAVPSGAVYADGGTGTGTSPIIVEVSGHCPSDPRAIDFQSDLCVHTKYGNASSAIFAIPGWDIGMKVLPATPPPWGIAFSYNCGARARDFYAGIWLTWDGVMPSAGSYHHGRSGSGYRMETYSWEDLWQLDGGEFNGGNIRMPTALLVRSVCTWHVRAVAGDEATVARYIPPIPRSAKRWGNCVDDACSRVVPYLVH